MNAAALTTQSIAADQWIPIDEASELIGWPLRTLRHKAKWQWASRGNAELRSPRSGHGKPTWWINRRIDRRLAAIPAGDVRAKLKRESLLAKYPAHRVEEAYRKMRWLQVWRDRLATPRIAGQTDRLIADQVVQEAKDKEGDSFKISIRSLQAWKASVREMDADGEIHSVESLISKYVHGPSDQNTRRSAEAIKHFYDLYRAEVRLSARICHDYTVRAARINQWDWPTGYTSTCRWLRKYDDIPMTYLCRQGHSAYSKKYMPYDEMDWSRISPGQFYTADHTQVDFWVLRRGKLIRPWFTVVQDCRSRCITGWRLGVSPNQEAILLAMRDAFRDWAIPNTFRVDNGKDFTSKTLMGLTKRECRRLRQESKKQGLNWKDLVKKTRNLVTCDDVKWQGVMNELGVKIILAIPYHAWSKGTVERFFRTFHDRCSKLIATYCGNSPVTRPQSVSKILSGKMGVKTGSLQFVDGSVVPTLQEAREHIAEFLEIYHQTNHRGEGISGKTPLSVWQSAGDSLQKADADALAFLMGIRGAFKVGPNGVSLTISGERLTYGKTSAALKRWMGRKVLVSVDPLHPAECFAFDPENRRMISRLDPNTKMDPLMESDDLREASAARNRETKAERAAARAAPKRTLTAVARANMARRAELAEVRATGTDDNNATIVPVRTGFEGQSKPVYVAPPPSAYDHISLDDIDLSPQTQSDPLDRSDVLDLHDVESSHDDVESDEYAEVDIDNLTFDVQT